MTDILDKIEFSPYPKTPRLFGGKDIIVSEKIDGTNAAIQIIPLSNLMEDPTQKVTDHIAWNISAYAHNCVLVAQSRNRIITPTSDNFNFAHWVSDNAEGLVEALGTGIHRGEWFGSGIQRGYGLKEKRFALFAIDRYKDSPLEKVSGLSVVPELWRGTFDTGRIKYELDALRMSGSKAVIGYTNPEGIIIYHEASRQVYKYTYIDEPKGEK